MIQHSFPTRRSSDLPYFDLAVDRFLTVPDPRLAVLRAAPRAFSAVRVRLTDAADGGEIRRA